MVLGGGMAGWAQEPPIGDGRTIIVNGIRIAQPVRAESELDQNGIAAFGADNVSDLLDALAMGTGNDGDGPVILINGELAGGMDDIADLPSEVVSKIQLLSRESAAAIGQRPTRRVINLVIKPDHGQVTGKGEGRLATAGQGWRGEGELNLLKLKNGNRRSLVVRMVDVDGLLEADRDVLTGDGSIPYDPAGNILSYPNPGGEIDPALSALAGQSVTVAGVPQDGTTLADFAALAGNPNLRGIGRYRSLLGADRNFSANGNLSQKVGKSSLAFNLRAETADSRSRIGGAVATFRVSANSPFSPFGNDVTLASVLGSPLTQESRRTVVAASAVANGPIGKWRYSLRGQFNGRSSHIESERGFDTTALQAEILAGQVDPFAPFDPSLFGALRIDRVRNKATDGGLVASANGNLLMLPAGPVRVAVRAEWRSLRSTSETTGSPSTLTRRVKRDDLVSQLTTQIPLLSNNQFGALGLELSGGYRAVTRGRAAVDYGGAVNWSQGASLSGRVALSVEQLPPPPNVLSDPVVTIDNARVFDFVRQETVLVTMITGGNPDLESEKRRTLTVGGNWRPLKTADASLSLDFVDSVGRDVYAPLPPVNAAVQTAFPSRFQRDATGQLVLVDARAVGFDRVRRQELRSGVVFSHLFGGDRGPGTGNSGSDAEDRILTMNGWRVSLAANHSWTLKSTRRAAPGLPIIDLLDGGALGYAGGQPRHRLNASLGVIHRGVGLNLDADYVGRSSVAAGTLAAPDRYRFSSRMLVDARLFANLGPMFPKVLAAKGARIAVGVQNVFNDHVVVRDQAGNVPSGYQRYLLDPLGRTVTFSLRKVF